MSEVYEVVIPFDNEGDAEVARMEIETYGGYIKAKVRKVNPDAHPE